MIDADDREKPASALFPPTLVLVIMAKGPLP